MTMTEQGTATAKTPRPGARQGATNEFTAFADVKPGHEEAIRETIAKWARDPNKLERIRRITTLHERRYVLFDNGKRVMFCTTFDGDWDKYIDDFGAAGVQYFNDIFQHTEGYPGMTDPSIKDWVVARQITATEYTRAYDATVKDILKALRVNDAFQQVLDNPAAAKVLKDPALQPLLAEAAD
jgi:hypothetical protein